MDDQGKTPEEKLAEEQALLDEYKKLKENSVSKEQYERDIKALEEKNKLYLKAITEGRRVDTPSEDTKPLAEAIKQVNKFKGTNLDFWKEHTSVIDRVLKETPEAEIIRITGQEGLDELIKVNTAMKQMVQDADGDPDYFRSLYSQRVKDSYPRMSSDIDNAGSLANYLMAQNNK